MPWLYDFFNFSNRFQSSNKFFLLVPGNFFGYNIGFFFFVVAFAGDRYINDYKTNRKLDFYNGRKTLGGVNALGP